VFCSVLFSKREIKDEDGFRRWERLNERALVETVQNLEEEWKREVYDALVQATDEDGLDCKRL
jgi:hypothetical protein